MINIQKLLLTTGLMICLSIIGCSQQQRGKSGKNTGEKSNKPNIVFILADDLGYNEVGVYGQTKIETPNIDALAHNGMQFTQYYAFPVCAPSRYLLMTGKHSGHAYIRANNGWSERGGENGWSYREMVANPALIGQWPIPDTTVTIGKLLQRAGYKTAFVGKWGLGGPMTVGVPTNQGFDLFYGYLGQWHAHQYYPVYLYKNGKRVPLNNKLMPPHQKFPENLDTMNPENYKKYRGQDYAPKLMLETSLQFIQTNSKDDQSFFLVYAPTLSHVSLQAPKEWIMKYHKKFGPEKPYLGDESYLPSRYPHATYAAMVSYLDMQVGKLIKKLKATGEYDNTLIIFSSDNGPTFNGGTDSPWFGTIPFRKHDRGREGWIDSLKVPYFKTKRGWAKGFVHEGGIRVPMIAVWNEKIEPGSRTRRISAVWDVLPTLADVAGIEAPKNIDGISFLPTLLGNEQKQHSYLYWEFPGYGGQQAVRMGKWKGIRMNIKDGNMEIQLFNLKKDVQEQHNVASKHPKVVQKIKHIMAKEHTIPKVDDFRMKALQLKKN